MPLVIFAVFPLFKNLCFDLAQFLISIYQAHWRCLGKENLDVCDNWELLCLADSPNLQRDTAASNMPPPSPPLNWEAGVSTPSSPVASSAECWREDAAVDQWHLSKLLSTSLSG